MLAFFIQNKETREAFQETPWGQIKETTETHQATETRLKEYRPYTQSNPYQQPHPWITAIKLHTTCSWIGTHRFSGQEPTVFLFDWQSNKTIHFYFTQNSISNNLVGISAQRLSFQHRYQRILLIVRKPTSLNSRNPSCGHWESF